MAPTKILIVDDEPEALENCCRILAGRQYECFAEADPRRALDMIRREHPQVMLTDLRMPGLDGISLLKSARQLDPAIKVVLLTAYASLQTAVASMRHGAFDYLAKPFTGNELRQVIRRALGKADGEVDAGEGGSQEPERHTDLRRVESALLGGSSAIQAVRAVVDQVAPTEAAVLITGERGAGKESVARVIHASSLRRARPFVPVDGPVPDEGFVETALFGSATMRPRGSRIRAGAFESAQGGTLYLDEVGGLSLRLQAKVLRALKERRARQVDGAEFYPIDVRVIATSSRDLRRACRCGEFREDLYQYLNVASITMPSLRQRVEDIEPLTRFFLQPFASGRSRRVPSACGFTPDALDKLRRYTWPGNLWELQHVVERAAALANHPLIELSSLPEHIHTL